MDSELFNEKITQFSIHRNTCSSIPEKSRIVAIIAVSYGTKSEWLINYPMMFTLSGKDFRYSSNLIIHKRSHIGERKHKCDVCDKKFVGIEQLKRHALIHTGQVSNYVGLPLSFFLHGSVRDREYISPRHVTEKSVDPFWRTVGSD